MIKTTMLSLALLLALLPVGMIEKTGASQSDVQDAAHPIVLCSPEISLSQTMATQIAAFSPVPGLTLIWPVSPDNRGNLGNDYSQFNLVVRDKYHTGLDIGAAVGRTVRAAADGRVVKIQENDIGCDRDPDSPAPTPCEDHGYGNTVIVEHTLPNNSVVYTQYSHLASIDESIKSACDAIDAN